jgi:hypothetical protein
MAAPKKSDPLRDAIATALREAEAAHAAVAQQRQAIAAMKEGVRDLQARIEKATGAVETARKNYAASLAAAAIDGGPAPTSGVGPARRAVENLEDELESRRAALEHLREGLSTLEAAAREADVVVEQAISACLAQHAASLLDQAFFKVRELAPLRALCATFFDHCLESAKGGDLTAFSRGRTPLGDAEERAREFLREASARPVQANNPWGKAREQLRIDPYVALPELSEAHG